MSGWSGNASGRNARTGSLAVASAAPAMRVARVEGFEAPFVLADADRAVYRRRFVTLFVLEGEGHSGGTGRVEHARNAQGEHVALKLLADPQRHGAESDEEHARRARAARAAFEREYECHAKLSGLKGFPRLFGRGQVAGVPCIVMEWVEGVTLDRVRRTLAVDGAGRVSPLVAARIGRDLFDLVARMGFVEGGFVHRDISPRNVMVRTSRLSLAQQVEEGVFDLYLIDFGSSADVDVATSFTRENAVFRGATADYAPPEMLSDDIPGLDELRKSSAIDVYAAASVVYRLASGHVPYELHGLSDDGRPLSPYRAKMAAAAPPAVMAHEDADALVDVLAREPEAAVAVQQAQDKLPAPASVAEAADALTFVDRMFAEVLADCLAREQADRPAAAAVREALSSFSVHYAENVERSLSGKPLVPCVPGGLIGGFPDAPNGALSLARITSKGVAAVALAAVAISAGVLVNGAAASFSLGGAFWEGAVPGAAVAAALAVPALAGLALRAGGSRTRAGFSRGTAGVAVAGAAEFKLLGCLQFQLAQKADGLAAALVAAMAAGWFVLVADYALNVALPQVKRLRALPDGGPALDGAALAAARAAALEAASRDAGEADIEPEYEIDDAQLGAGGAQASEGA